jgi:hypothetical protein
VETNCAGGKLSTTDSWVGCALTIYADSFKTVFNLKMTQEHPVTPSQALVQRWFLGAKALPPNQWVIDVANEAAQWGADTELEACCALVEVDPCCGTKFQRRILVKKLREARRPKPRGSDKRPTDRELQEVYLEGYYSCKDRNGPDAQAAGLRAVLNRWGSEAVN